MTDDVLTVLYSWAHFGFGFTMEDRDPDKTTAPYINMTTLDKKWIARFQNASAEC